MSEQEEITEQQAVQLAGSGFWKTMTHRQIAEFQMHTSRLCMPFGVFHEAVEKALGRPVWTHEFGLALDALKAELRGDRGAPTFSEIMNLIPEEKRVLIVLKETAAAMDGERP